jgi:molecular chaperone Hsp33
MRKWVSGASHPFTGQVMLEYGSIGHDLAHYYLTSEQIPTSFSLSIDFGKAGEILGAAGLLIQALPGTSADEAGLLEDQVVALPSLGKFFSSRGTADSFLSGHLGAFNPRILDTKPVDFFCPCSKERFQSFLRSMKPEDQDEILKDGPFPLETRCHNCNSVYSFTRPELEGLFRRA